MIFITGLSLQVVFLVQIYYALLGLTQPAIRRVFIWMIMCSYIAVFVLVFLSLFFNVVITLNGIHLVLTALCVFCLVSLLIYGGKIYKEMKRIEVSRNIIIKAGHLSAVNDR